MTRENKILAKAVVEECANQQAMIATAESCTGGLISAALTDVSGSSAIFDRGFTTYSNQAKEELLGVSKSLLEKYGAVSAEVAEAMAIGALKRSLATVTVSVTGIAGPSGGTAEKPVGLVWFGLADQSNVHVEQKVFADKDRDAVRQATVHHALTLILANLTQNS